MWVAIVYDGTDKIGSHLFRVESEEEARGQAEEWVDDNYGKGTDWVLHKISEHQ